MTGEWDKKSDIRHWKYLSSSFISVHSEDFIMSLYGFVTNLTTTALKQLNVDLLDNLSVHLH